MFKSRLQMAVAVTLILISGAPTAHAASRGTQLLFRSEAWTQPTVAAIGTVKEEATPLESAGNVLALYYTAADDLNFRVSLVSPHGIHDGIDHFSRNDVQILILLDEAPGGETRLPAPLDGPAPLAWERVIRVGPTGSASPTALRSSAETWLPLGEQRVARHLRDGWVAAMVNRAAAEPVAAAVVTYSGSRVLDTLSASLGAEAQPSGNANVAFVHHGNQGLAYSDVFFGRSGAELESGYDEILEEHQSRSLPGNFHLGTLLQSAAEWDARNGAPVDFNAWLSAGVTEGWAQMMTSAYGQPIQPFLQSSMNDWAVQRHVAMTSFRYNYVPHTAWVPERVWLTTGSYPNGSVIDYSGDHWQTHGVWGVILDDWPHLQGHDNHQIHFNSGNNLRLIPRDGDFTGKMHAGDGTGALAILTGVANSGVGDFRIVVYADDWEMAAAVAGWESTFPFALGTYRWMMDKCQTESAWLSTWKLDAALTNANFNGDTFTPTYGTYGSIGGTDGYGGGNNGWYSDWAGYVPFANGGDGFGGCGGGGNCKNHGQIWNDAHSALQSAPDNGIREAGWYVMMTNLHETGWHDYLGGPISGWQLQYSGHIKNTNIYAEAARWAGGEFAGTTGAFLSDVDNDGNEEMVLHNDRVMAVFESIGGRCTHLFAKGSGYEYSVIGVDNAFWAGTQADFNDVNHIAGLSDVGPNYANDFYSMQVDAAAGDTVQATFTHRSGLTKTVKLYLGQPYLDCVYRTGSSTQWIQSGWSPDLVDLVWNAEMDRVWVGSQAYMGRRNPNTSATAAYVLGSGGANFQKEIGATLMKADEIYGNGKFRFYIFAGPTSTPAPDGSIAELDALAAGLTDVLPPEAVTGTFFPATQQMTVRFDEPVRWNEVVVTGFSIDDDDDGLAELTLDGATAVVNTENSTVLSLQLTPADAAAIDALDRNNMRLLLVAASVKDEGGNPNETLTNQGDVFISYGPPTAITLDGRFDEAEWPECTIAVLDTMDSSWNPPGAVENEIQALYATWDATYLYLGIRGVVTGNSWLLYLDTDPLGPDGEDDLTRIDSWERGATFPFSVFMADWQFGAYQHQDQYDGQSFFQILTDTTTADSTSAILAAFDPQHDNGLDGGSEIAIPWDVLYSLGSGQVPVGASIGMVASLCWDPEPDGELGGDQAPNLISVLPPMLDVFHEVIIDADNDGLPDPIDRQPPEMVSATPGSNDTTVFVLFDEAVSAVTANQPSRYTVFQTLQPSVTISVLGAALQPDDVTVELTTESLSPGDFTVTAAGIADTTCFANTANQTSAEFTSVVAVGERPGSHLQLALRAPYPNPMRGQSALVYTVPSSPGSASPAVRLDLYDLAGRHLRTLASDPAGTPGEYHVLFDGRGRDGSRLAPGIYFVRLSRGSENLAKRVVILD
jgi:hypothetical protein